MKTKEFADKKILILGLGREGLSSYRFLRRNFPEITIGLSDKLSQNQLNDEFQNLIKSDKKLITYLGDSYLNHLLDYEIIIKTPGIPPTIPEIAKAQKQGVKITSQTEIFFQNCKGKIIGITGTKGKSTTSSIVYEVLKAGQKPVILVGNVGIPALDFLEKITEDSLVVFELSSHQLADLKTSPQIAILQNIVPEHLDYYPDFTSYINAKANIALHQKPDDYLIYNADYPIPKKIAQKSQAIKIPFSMKKLTTDGCFVVGDQIIYRKKDQEEIIITTSQIPLVGKFNIQNVLPAIIAGKLNNIPMDRISQAIENFKSLPHRLEYVGCYKGIKFYNDSLATIPEAAIEAIEAFENNVQTIILGGFDRSLNFEFLAKKILESNIKTLILFLVSGQKIWQEIEKNKQPDQDLPKHYFVESMEEAVKIAYQETDIGKICLLSPASPSFGIFKDYADRGNQFKTYVCNQEKRN